MSVSHVQLGEVTETVMGQAPPGFECNKEGQGTPFVKAGEFSDVQPIIREWTTKPLKFARSGDVLVCVVGATAGKVNLAFDCAIGRSVAAVRPKPSALDASYLYRYLQTKVDHLRGSSQGLAQGVITRDMLSALKIPLPPLPEQRRIAAILDKADALRRKRKGAIELLDSLSQSIFLEMFGDPTKNPRSWPVKELGYLAGNENARRIPLKSSDRDKRDGNYPYYGASGIIDHIDDYLYEGRRLLVAEDGANLLSRSTPISFFAEGRFWVNNHAHVLADNGCISLTYLREFFRSIDLSPYVTGSAQPKLNRANLDGISVPVPSRDLQTHFEAVVTTLEATASLSSQTDISIDMLFSSLQHRSFSGQL